MTKYAAVILLTVFGFCLGVPRVAGAFSVGTQNLYHYNTRLSERMEHLQREVQIDGVPDIIGFQEAARWTLSLSLYDRFVDLTTFGGIYKKTNEFLVMSDGISLLSRLRGTHFESHWLPKTKKFSRQAMTAGRFHTESGEVLVVNTHFSPFPENQWRRKAQAKFVLQYIAQQSIGPSVGVPVVIVGDLNDSYDSSVLDLFKQAGFEDVLDGQHSTYDPASNPLVTDAQYGASRLDYILYQPARLKVESAGYIFKENWVSDHYGLSATFSPR